MDDATGKRELATGQELDLKNDYQTGNEFEFISDVGIFEMPCVLGFWMNHKMGTGP